MSILIIELTVNAPIERVFDLARCIDLHEATMSRHKEKAIGGVTKGLIGMGESVTWEATHFGIEQKLTSKITAFERPKHFRDSIVKGAFRRFDHDHFFEQSNGQNSMKDVFDYDSPLGIFGIIADVYFWKNICEKY